MTADRHWIKGNRAPVLTLWAAVVAERLGFNKKESLTLGRAVAGLNAFSKGQSLGIFKPTKKALDKKRREVRDSEILYVDLLGRSVPTMLVEGSLRALSKDKPIDPDSVSRYLDGKFGDALDDARGAMEDLARSRPPKDLAEQAFGLYANFRPTIPAGKKGWGAEGRLSLDKLRELAEKS